jgi:tRNA pseudouridine38-40 synthase
LRYLVRLSYVGTRYRGWQRQTNTLSSVQQKLEDTFAKMLKTKVTLVGCGRTDAGVHAKAYYAHFDLDFDFTYDPVERLNRMLPDDIVIHELRIVNEKWHARFDAVSRMYKYYIHTSLDPFLHEVSTFYPLKKINESAIQDALIFIKNLEDFKYLCLTPDDHNTTICTMYEAGFESTEEHKILIFTFRANRFLKSMIRAIMYLIIELALENITIEQFKNICTGNSHLKAIKLAYPNGLHLEDIEYPEVKFNV